MVRVTATEAKNQLGRVLEQAQRSPVVIEKAGRRHSVIVSAEHYDQLVASARGLVGGADPGKDFYGRYKAWVDAQNRLVEEHGVFGEEWRAW